MYSSSRFSFVVEATSAQKMVYSELTKSCFWLLYQLCMECPISWARVETDS